MNNTKIETKEELYRKIVEIQKASGQGLPGIVLDADPNIATMTEELIEEGWVIENRVSESTYMGSPRSMYFYMPSKGYNVFEDDGNLNYIRLYLDCLDEEDGPVNPSRKRLIQDVEFMASYVKWIKKHEEDLEILVNLDPHEYVPKDITLNQEQLDYLKSRKAYSDKILVCEMIEEINNPTDLMEEMMSINKRIVELKEVKGEKDEEREKEIEDYTNEINTILHIDKYLKTKDQHERVCTVI